jgi:hypothetical protein
MTNSTSQTDCLCSTADEVGLWQLRDQEHLYKWTKGSELKFHPLSMAHSGFLLCVHSAAH